MICAIMEPNPWPRRYYNSRRGKFKCPHLKPTSNAKPVATALP